MDLEVISRMPKGRARPTPLLFVHGAYGGAWVWDYHFLPYFAEHGYAAHALSLRGHGESNGWEKLAFARLRDYVADVEQVANTLPAPPVLIGHSMGGMVVQKYMHAHPIPAAVLMSSLPPHGMIGSWYGMAFTNPSLFRKMTMIQTFGATTVDPDITREALFSEDTPESTILACVPRFQRESALVILDLLGLDLPPSTPTLDLPVLVLGAANDAFVFQRGLDATASTYRTKAEVFPMAHAMMLEHGWQKVADRILEWLEATLPSQPRDATRKADRPQPAAT